MRLIPAFPALKYFVAVTRVELVISVAALPVSRTMIRKFCLLSIVVLAFAAPSSASAYWPYWGYGGWGQSGYGLGFNYASNYVPAPPYYAIYPPVYYSQQITARPYGASPFAWPAGFSPITYVPEGDYTVPAPGTIENPYVTRRPATSQAAPPAGEVKPVSLDNPFIAAR